MKLKYRKGFVQGSTSCEIVYCQGIRAEGRIICDWHIKQEAIEDPRDKNPHAVALGSLGGKSKSIAKAEAAKRNGKNGGRPHNPVLQ